MANNKVKVKGINGRSNRPMSYDHVTTIDLNVVKPFGIWEMLPGDRLDLSPEVWMRTQNLACPTFGKVDCITRAFFVPHRLIFNHFLDFWSGNTFRPANSTTSYGLYSCPHCTLKDFSDAFVERFTIESDQHFDQAYIDVEPWETGTEFSLTFGLELGDSHATNDYSDFDIHFGATHSHYRFNPLGKRVWDFFYSLGYRFNFSVDGTQDNYNNGHEENWNYPVSLMPVLSYLKIFYDWYCPSEFRYLFSIDAYKDVNNFPYSRIQLRDIFDMVSYAVFIWYNDDIFSLCEHAPYSKRQNAQMAVLNQSVRQHQTQKDQDEIISWSANSYSEVRAHSKVGAYVEDAPNVQDANSWTVRAMQRVANLLQKNNLLSPRAQDYLKAKLGVTPTAARMDVSEYLGHAAAPVKISDVVSTQASDDALGELGGKGTSYQIQNLKYNAEEFGYFILTIELRPRVDYGQGFNPMVLRVQKEDFWQEEIDGLGFTPVPTNCLVSGPQSHAHVNEAYSGSVFNLSSTDNRIFGYLPKFWSYKITHGNLSGDFNIPKNIDIQAYHLFRNVEPKALNDWVHNSLKFRYPGLCFFDNDYTRIFMHPDRGTLRDHFQLIGSFECNINGYALSLSESWQVNPDGEERQGSEQHIQSVL